jgi:uncharacterized protein (DUF983 family)
MSAVTGPSLTLASFAAVKAVWNLPMQKRLIIWLPAFAILAMAMAAAIVAPPDPLTPPAAQRADG